MEKSGKFYECRERLDRTLASPTLTDVDELKTLISKQLEGSTDEKVIEKRAIEASNFLGMLRGAGVSGNEDSERTKVAVAATAVVGEWNLKESNEEFRVMYREGPLGTPMHTLFVEGYVDGPTDTCLCLGWESTLYHKWWPQFNFPNFKIAVSKSLQKVRFGEQISLLRMKIAWPLSARESVLHYFMFEYLEEGLVVVLLNSISDSDSIDVKTHGYSGDGIPEAEDVVRMDLVGGFAVQRVNSERSYVCLIGNIDFKLDFMPPSLINFVARQLIGGGYKLYQKAVVSTSKYDQDYVKALRDPLYARLRDIFGEEPHDVVVEEREEVNSNESPAEATKVAAKSLMVAAVLDEKVSGHFEEGKRQVVLKNETTSTNCMSFEACGTVIREMGEADSEDGRKREDEDGGEPRYVAQYAIVLVCPDLNQAIGTLERGIAMVRRYGVSVLARRSFSRPNNNRRSGRSSNAEVVSLATSKLGAFAREHTTDGGVGVQVSNGLMEKAPEGPQTIGSYINCSGAELESGKASDGEPRNGMDEMATEGSEEEKIDGKRGGRLRKRRYLTSCFGYQ